MVRSFVDGLDVLGEVESTVELGLVDRQVECGFRQGCLGYLQFVFELGLPPLEDVVGDGLVE